MTEFALVLHFHQPVGNFDHVFEQVTERCYAPLIQLLSAFPEIKSHLHFNGILLEWFDRHRPDVIVAIEQLVRSGSVELLTGGYCEPILTVLPEADAIGQVVALTDDLERRFGRRPVGAWLTERVWEPRLPTPLFEAGVRYVTLDDVIFRWAGIDAGRLGGHYVTDDAGRPLALFPAAKSLRYTIPFRPQAETFELLHGCGGTAPLMVYADDAEKFGEWPGTHEWVFERGWLKKFLEMLAADTGVRTVHLSERLQQHRPLGRTYPPTASYPEMTVWALPTPARARMEALMHDLEKEDPLGLLPDLRGGHWRGFLGKYPEANRLHKRMLRVSRRLHRLEEPLEERGELAAAVRDLYQGQCNDAYWHGVFGGLYLPHLRRSVESFLIRAERRLDRLEHGDQTFGHARREDLDADGVEEILLTTGKSQAVVDPADGTLLSWDLRDSCKNLVTVMQRHEEPFHADLRAGRFVQVDEAGLPLVQDEPEEGVATIHGAVRVKPGIGPEDLQVDHHSRVANLLWSAPAEALQAGPSGIGQVARRLSGPWVADVDGTSAGCTLRSEQEGLAVVQEFRLAADEARIEWSAEVEPRGGPRTLYAEWNLFVGWTGDDLQCNDGGSFLGAAGGERPLGGVLDFRGGGEQSLTIASDGEGTLRWEPVHTVSSSEAGLEKVGQGTVFLFAWRIDRPRTLRLSLTAGGAVLADEDPVR